MSSFQTQYELLKSRVLVSKVIDDLNINEASTDSSKTSLSAIALQYIKDLISWEGENRPTYELGGYPLENKFLEGLSISPVKKSQIVSISYESEDPRFATDAANAVANNFIEMTADRREGATVRPTIFSRKAYKPCQIVWA